MCNFEVYFYIAFLLLLESVEGSLTVFISPALAFKGTTVSLFCPFYVDPTHAVKWYKDGQAINTAQSKYRVKSSSTILSISSVASSDVGSYTCSLILTGSGSVQNVSAPGILKISVAPEATIIPSNESLRILVGSMLKMQCIGSVNALFVLWSFNGKQLSSSSRHRIALQSIRNAVLTIPSVDKRDGGVYSCEAFTQKERVARNTTITIEYPPSSVWVQAEKNESIPGERLVLDCQCDSEPPATFHWTHNGSVIVGATSNYYIIDQVKYGDSGTYSCIATNYLGSANNSNAIEVKPGLSLTFEPVHKVAVLGDELILVCSESSSPAVSPVSLQQLWFKYSSASKREILQSNGTYLIHQNGTLCITRVALTDIATFQCQIKSIGIFLQRFVVNVVYHPSKVRDIKMDRIRFRTYNLSWLPPEDSGNSLLDGYTVQYQRKSTRTVSPWVSLQLDLGLYQFTIVASNDANLRGNGKELFVNLHDQYTPTSGYLLIVSTDCGKGFGLESESIAAGLTKLAGSACSCTTNVKVERIQNCEGAGARVKVSAEFELSSLFERFEMDLGSGIRYNVAVESDGNACDMGQLAELGCSQGIAPPTASTRNKNVVILAASAGAAAGAILLIAVALFCRRLKSKQDETASQKSSASDGQFRMTNLRSSEKKGNVSTLL